MAGPRDKEAAEQRARVVRGITLARKVLIIRETSSGRCFHPAVRGIAASWRREHVLPLTKFRARASLQLVSRVNTISSCKRMTLPRHRRRTADSRIKRSESFRHPPSSPLSLHFLGTSLSVLRRGRVRRKESLCERLSSRRPHGPPFHAIHNSFPSYYSIRSSELREFLSRRIK